MRYLYQKDERALPGNLLNRIYRFFLSYKNSLVRREPPFREDGSTEAEEWPFLEAVTRKRLVKTLQAEKKIQRVL
jgi:hypothetical protein